jgi:quinoprotein glucose dehydrogenase
MSVDAARGLVFLPTSSASPDFYGGLRPGDNRHANSVVALRLESGAMAWSFQTVHHDVWDYDVPMQPTLAAIRVNSQLKDVVIVGNKQAMVFVLDRDSGKPVFPVEERAVPQGGAAGEALSPTQPFPADLPLLAPSVLNAEHAWGLTFWDRGAAATGLRRRAGASTRRRATRTILFQFTGGINWGSVAIDSATDVVYVNTTRLVHIVTLFPAGSWTRCARNSRVSRSPAAGTPFGMKLGGALAAPVHPPPVPLAHRDDVKRT